MALLSVAPVQAAFATGPGRAIELFGIYDGSAYNPRTGKPYFDYRRVSAAFEATILGEQWKIAATNLNTRETATLWFDGQSTFCLKHTRSGSPASNIVVADISPTEFYISGGNDPLDLCVPWVAYGLNPTAICSDKNNSISTVPLPWLGPAYDTQAYGYRWHIIPTLDGRFASQFSTVRDRSLFAHINQVLLSSNFVYPTSLAALNRSRFAFMIFKRQIPNGFVEAKYDCQAWYETNGESLPAASQFETFIDPHFHFPGFKGHLTVSKAVVRDMELQIAPPIETLVHVADFRYRMANGKRIFRGATYLLTPGSDWRTARDPALLAQAQYYLKHGPRYDEYTSNEDVIIWGLFSILAITPIVALLWSKSKQRKKNEQ
ncbi:MAG: hypothetical protein ACREFR_12040 [Limisphaerales bacterium]